MLWKHHRILAALVICVLLFGCTKQTESPLPPPTLGESTPPATDISATTVDYAIPDATDQDALERMLYTLAAAVPDPFSTPDQIPAYELARFLYQRMKDTGAADGFERSNDGGTVDIPVDILRDWAGAYFGLTELKIDFMTQQYFDGQYLRIPEQLPQLGITYRLGETDYPTTGNTFTLTLLAQSGETDYQRQIYNLRTDEDGNVQIASKRVVPSEFGLYAINNADARLSTLVGVPVNSMTAKSFRFLTFGNNLLVSIQSGKELRLGILDTTTAKSDKYITLSEADPVLLPRLSTSGESVLLYYTDRVVVLDSALLQTASISYPDELLSFFDERTDNLALSPDMTQIAFSDSEALWYFSFQRNTRQMVLEHPTDRVPTVGNPQQYWQPLSEFDPKTGQLLIGTQNRNGTSALAVTDQEGTYRMVNIAGGPDMQLRFLGDTVLAFNPTSVRKVPQLPHTFAQYNLYTSTLLTQDTNFTAFLTGSLLGDQGLYYPTVIPIGNALAESCSLRLLLAKNGKVQNSDFGYVDKNAQLTLRAVTPNGKVAALCSGLFINSIVITS